MPASTSRRNDDGMTALALCLVFLTAPGGSTVSGDARFGGGQGAQSNTWSARSSTGQTLAGTWTYVVDPATATVTGSWTLLDAQGRPVMRGAWSAVKARTRWTGAWRAAAAGSTTEHSGTWSARVALKPDAKFPDLFKLAVRAVVSGTWRAGGRSGAWSIRASE